MPVPYIADVDPTKLHFAPITFDTNRKKVDLFFDASSTSNRNRIWIQVCPDNTKPVETRFGLDTVKDDQKDPCRRGLTVRITDPATIAGFTAFDDAVIAAAYKNCREWFKKNLSEAEIRAKYKKLLFTPQNDEEGTLCLKFKVKCTGAQVPTKMMRNLGNNKVKRCDESYLISPGAKVVPVLSAFTVWFMGMDSFGVSFQAEELIITPGASRSALSNFTLKEPFEVVDDDDDDETVGKREAGDDAESSAKRLKVELVDGAESAM